MEVSVTHASYKVTQPGFEPTSLVPGALFNYYTIRQKPGH